MHHLRAEAFPRYLPVLATIEKDDGTTATQAATEAGVDDVLVEPMAADELAARIRTLLSISQLSRDLMIVRQRESLYKSAVEQSPVGVCLLDQEAVITFASRRLGQMTGRESEMLLGRRIEELLDAGQRETFPLRLARCRSGKDDMHELTLLNEDGSKHPVLAITHPLLNDSGQYKGCIVAWAEIQGRDLRLRQAALAERMDSVAHLAGQLAHDFNNILTIILGNASLLRQALFNQPEPTGLVMEIIKAGNRAAEINRRLVTMGFRRLAANTPVDVHKVLHEVASEIQQSPEAPLKVETTYLAAASAVDGDADELHASMLKLAKRLQDAMRHTGILTFQTRNLTLDAIDCEKKPFSITPGAYVEVELASHSVVPVPADQESPRRRGRAELELAGVFAAIRAHRGSIELDNQTSEGLTTVLLLPVAQERKELPNEEAEDR